MAQSGASAGSFGPNAWLVDDMYDRFLVDPSSVSDSWRKFFADSRQPPPGSPGRRSRSRRTVAVSVAPSAPVRPTPLRHRGPAGVEEAVLLKGAASRIVANMEASLGVPTATSVRTVPARLLEVNRQILNNQWRVPRGPRSASRISSATPSCAPSDVRFSTGVRRRCQRYGQAGRHPPQARGPRAGSDQQKSDGPRTCSCRASARPTHSTSDPSSWPTKTSSARSTPRKIFPDDFGGTTVSLTNPGTLGTAQSVPRLMPGQGAIIGVGALGYPAGYEAADPRVLAQLGLGKVVT